VRRPARALPNPSAEIKGTFKRRRSAPERSEFYRHIGIYANMTFDASPLIAFHQLDALRLLHALFGEVVIPPAVAASLGAQHHQRVDASGAPGRVDDGQEG